MRFLHCSDVHVTANYAAIPFLKLGWRRWIALGELTFGGRAAAYAQAPETLHQIVRDCETHRVDHLLVTGDLTAYALPNEFEGAHSALRPFSSDPRRCTMVPGNHDTYTPGAHHDGRFEKWFGPLTEGALPEYARERGFPFVKLLGEDTAVVGLLSARVPPVPGASWGLIGKRQLEGLAALVEDARLRHRAVLVMVHHAPLRQDGRPDKLHHGLVDAEALFRVVRGERFAVLHGHIHRRYHHPATADRPHVFGAGSSTQAGREGYWIIDTADGRIREAQAWAPGASAPAFSAQLGAPGSARP
jgi:3',5'-cyclic AMP phosphodiesterase CpdA